MFGGTRRIVEGVPSSVVISLVQAVTYGPQGPDEEGSSGTSRAIPRLPWRAGRV